jgi:SPRY domain-containing SOCS box protein 1/4
MLSLFFALCDIGEAPVHSVGYHSLVGNTEHSWGWDLTRNKLFHDHRNSPDSQPKAYPSLNADPAQSTTANKTEEGFVVPDKFNGELKSASSIIDFLRHISIFIVIAPLFFDYIKCIF